MPFPQTMHLHTYTQVFYHPAVFWSPKPGDAGFWLVNWAMLTSSLSLPGHRQDRSIAENCEIDGLQAVCVAKLIEFPHQTPVVWTGACHNTHTPLPPPGPVSVFELTAALLLLFTSQQQVGRQSYLLCALSFLFLFHLFLTPFQAESDFLLTAAWSESFVILQA